MLDMEKIPVKMSGDLMRMETLYDALAETLKMAGAMRDYDTLELYLPAVYRDQDGIGGAKPADPLTLYVTRHDGDGHYIQAWKVSLADVVDQLLSDWANGDDTDTEAVRAVASGLESLALEIRQTVG